MKKNEYIELLLKDNETSGAKQKLFADVIDCTEIALSQTPDNFDIDASIGLEKLFKVIEDVGRKSSNHCVGPFEAAELIAKLLGTSYVRASRRKEQKIVNLEDFL
ncbi:MAG: hypothetical protein KH328_01440 [Staphylococcus sp.]|jgi:hypothetical protein|nr:hypothetical protein [Staphylococcus sp.]